MQIQYKTIRNSKGWDYFILVSRFLLAWTFLSYGFAKLTGGQFGITEAELLMPVKDLSLFRLSWYLFDHQPFKAVTGILEVSCGILLLYNRTAVLGALLFLPITATILLIDISFMPKPLAVAFTWRLSFYMLLALLILWHYSDRVKIIINAVSIGINTKFKHSKLAYLLLPILAIFLEVLLFMPKMITGLIFNTSATLEALGQIPVLVLEILKKFGL